MRILVVEDEAKVAADIAGALRNAGYLPDLVDNGEDAWFQGETEDYAAILLDLGLPQMDGLSVLKKWRAADITTPVVILTARGSWAERVDGIDAGADDYLPKPFQMEEMLARLRAVLRRSAGQASSTVRHGSVLFDPRLMRVSVDGVPIQISPLEYRAVACLFHHRGRVVPQLELSEHIYGADADRNNNALEALIKRLRRKIGADLIETRRGHGYLIPDKSPDDAE